MTEPNYFDRFCACDKNHLLCDPSKNLIKHPYWEFIPQTEEERAIITNTLNTYRSLLATKGHKQMNETLPSASDMLQLVSI